MVKKAMITWNENRIWNVTDKVQDARKELDSVQTALQSYPLSRELIQDERKANGWLKRASRAGEFFQIQNSREHVINLGDNNTEFFFRSVQARRMADKMSCIKDDNGEVLEDVERIR